MPSTPNRFLLNCLLIYSCLAFTQIQGQSICDENRHGQVIIDQKNDANLDAICECVGIKDLWIKKRVITLLPECIVNLDSLQSLSFSKCELSRIPDEVFQLENVRSLDFSFTSLYVLPHEITNLKNLVSLDLKHTFVETLPEGLDHIETIDMRYIDMNHQSQKALKAQYPNIVFHFSSPCNCN